MKKCVVSLYGGPGCGKTTAAASLYAHLKQKGLNVEMAPEIAKEFVLEENKVALSYQLMVWANQCYRIYAAYRHADIVITDAPILLGAIYNENASPAFIDVIMEQYDSFNNINIVVPRQDTIGHSMVGRLHSLTQSISIDNQIVHLLDRHNIPYMTYQGDNELLTNRILEELK
jgi:nucleoside-triphosphatase THEP1